MSEYGSTARVFLVVTFSVIAALLLAILPLPDWAVWLRPRWIVLVVIFWAMTLPYRFGVGSAWTIGLVSDLIQGTLIGEQALALALIAFIVIKFQQRIQLFSAMQRTIAVFVLVLFYQLLMFTIQSMLGRMQFSLLYWLAPFTSALFWPWIYIVLKSAQQFFRIADPSARGLRFGRG